MSVAYEEALALLDLTAQFDYLAASDCKVQELVALLERVREAKRTLADAEDHISRAIYAELGKGPHMVGDKPVEVLPGKDRTEWQHDELRRAAIVELAKARGGDITEVEEIVTAWTEVCGTSGWKIRGLRALDLDPDEYSHARPGKPSVRLP